MPKTNEPDFEKALAELETLVARLEHGDLPLEESLRTFERGVVLTRQCQTALQAAHQKVEILIKRGAEAAVVPLNEPGAETTQAATDKE